MTQFKTGITFGAFDPLHYGHVELLRRARAQCDKLIVVVSDGEYIQSKKGHPERYPLHDRMRALMLLRCVDEVQVQSIKNGKEYWCGFFQPDVCFVGDDWTPETFNGGRKLSVPVVFLPHTEGISSTDITKKV